MKHKTVQIEGVDIEELMKILKDNFEAKIPTQYKGKEIRLSIGEAAKLKGITTETLHKWARSGDIIITNGKVLLKDFLNCKRGKGDRKV